MLTRSLAKNNKLCIHCTCTINFKKLTERERKNYFGTLHCPDCYEEKFTKPLTLFDV